MYTPVKPDDRFTAVRVNAPITIDNSARLNGCFLRDKKCSAEKTIRHPKNINAIPHQGI